MTTTRIKPNATGGWNIEAHIDGRWVFQGWTAGDKEDARQCERDVKARLKGEVVL